jgi:acyl-CoA hydrolase
MTKKVKDSIIENIELVQPNDTNILGNLHGGRLMHFMDVTAAIAAAKHCNNVAVTAALDNLVFHHPIHLGDIIRLKASVNRTFNTSLEVGIRVEVENIQTGEVFHSNSAYFTFVNIDRETGKPLKVNEIIPETSVEIRRFEQALQRREQRLKAKSGIFKK